MATLTCFGGLNTDILADTCKISRVYYLKLFEYYTGLKNILIY